MCFSWVPSSCVCNVHMYCERKSEATFRCKSMRRPATLNAGKGTDYVDDMIPAAGILFRSWLMWLGRISTRQKRRERFTEALTKSSGEGAPRVCIEVESAEGKRCGDRTKLRFLGLVAVSKGIMRVLSSCGNFVADAFSARRVEKSRLYPISLFLRLNCGWWRYVLYVQEFAPLSSSSCVFISYVADVSELYVPLL